MQKNKRVTRKVSLGINESSSSLSASSSGGTANNLSNSHRMRWHANIFVVVVSTIIYSTASKTNENISVTYNIPDFVVHIDISTHKRLSGLVVFYFCFSRVCFFFPIKLLMITKWWRKRGFLFDVQINYFNHGRCWSEQRSSGTVNESISKRIWSSSHLESRNEQVRNKSSERSFKVWGNLNWERCLFTV